MPSIKDAERLVKRLVLANFGIRKGLAITPLLIGSHGIGKSQILNKVAADLGGKCLVIEGGSLGEGEITGLPAAFKTFDGSTELQFVPYYQIHKIQSMEKLYYDKAKNGFMDGKVKLMPDGTIYTELTKGEKKVYPARDELDIVSEGGINKYKFGENLDVNVKLALIESGEIKPVILFIDELNRTEQQVMKELMNIILNRSVNGYDLPWWVQIVSAINPCSQDSVYATNEMDDAQKDRFLQLHVNAKIEDWIDYANDVGLNKEVLEGIVATEEIFMPVASRKNAINQEDEVTPTPRSWEMVSNLFDTIYTFNDSKYFSSDEKKSVDDDLQTLVKGKVGSAAGRTFFQNLADKSQTIKPQDILNGDSADLDKTIVNKFNGQKKLRQKLTTDSVLKYICDHICEYEAMDKSADPKKKIKYYNFIQQIKKFVAIMDDATQLAFVKKISNVDEIKATDGHNVFSKIAAKCFAKDMLAKLTDYKSNLNNLKADE